MSPCWEAYFSVDVALKIGKLVQVLIEFPEKVTGRKLLAILLQQESFTSTRIGLFRVRTAWASTSTLMSYWNDESKSANVAAH